MDNINLDAQYNIVKVWFENNIGTMKQCSVATGIDRANICRYVATMRNKGIMYFHHVGVDEVTGCKAGFFHVRPAHNTI